MSDARNNKNSYFLSDGTNSSADKKYGISSLRESSFIFLFSSK